MALGHNSPPFTLILFYHMRLILLFLTGILITGSTRTYGAALEINRHGSSHRLRLDVLEAVLRHRLETQPLAKGVKCYVYVNRGLGAGIDARLPGYDIVVGSGKIGSVARKQRWYWLDIREITEYNATVVIEDATSFKVARLRSINGQWRLVSEKPYYLT